MALKNFRCSSAGRKCSLVLKFFVVLSALVGILLQCGIVHGSFSLESFRMFTTLSNLAVVIYFIYDIIMIIRTGSSDTFGRRWKFMITMGILLTGLVAFFMLRGMFDSLPATEQFGIALLHDVVPVSVFLDWVIFDRKGQAQIWMPLFATLFPIAYVLISMTVETVSRRGDYPYPFLNVNALGWPMVLLNILGLSVGFIAVGYLGYAIDHKLGKHQESE